MFEQLRRLGLHHQTEAGTAPAVRGQKVEEMPLRHQDDELAGRRQPCEIHRDLRIANHTREPIDLAARQFEKVVDEGRGMDGIAAKVAQEVAMLFRTSTPARARRNPSISPLGPPPAMQHSVVMLVTSIRWQMSLEYHRFHSPARLP